MNHYEILGVRRDATEADVKRAYRRASKHAHPDREGGSHERMQAVNAAYAVLGDARRRADYDAGGDGHQEADPLAGARAELRSLFMQVLQKAPEHIDPVEHLKQELKVNMQRMLANSTRLREIAALARKRARRIRHKDGAENLLAQVAESLAQRAEADVVEQAKSITQVGQMQAMLGDYVYELTDAEKAEMSALRKGELVGNPYAALDADFISVMDEMFGARGGPKFHRGNFR